MCSLCALWGLQEGQAMPAASSDLSHAFGDSGVLFITYSLLISLGQASTCRHLTLAQWRKERKDKKQDATDDALYEVR